MNKIERMLQELCSNGVEYFLFGEVCEYVRGITYNKSQEVKSANENAWRVFRANNITLSSNTLNYEDIKLVSKNVKVKETQILRHGDILICAGSGSKEHIGKVAYIPENMDYTFGGFMAVIRCSKNLNSRFLFHILASEMFSDYLSSALNSSTINNLNAGIIKDFSIPVPPLPIQEEIVRILDHFTELTASLQAELQTRQEQYKYYKDQLLKLNVAEYRTLGSLSKFRRGSFPQPYGNKDWYDGDGAMPFVQVADIADDKKLVANTKRKISSLAQPMSVFAPKGSIIISLQGSIGKIAITQYDAYIDRTLAIFQNITNDVLPKYFVYQLERIFEIKEKTARGSTIKTITKEEFTNFQIPIPSISEQKRIVSILDKFETLVNDLSKGLPAEIAAVQEQYEYYRNKLLMFNRIKSN